MEIDQALTILESEKIKVIKTPEQLEAARLRRQARREKIRKENEMVVFKYSIWSPLRYSDELWKWASKYEKELQAWGDKNSYRGHKITVSTDSDHDDYYVIKFYISAPRKFEEELKKYFESKKDAAPWWMDYGIRGLTIMGK